LTVHAVLSKEDDAEMAVPELSADPQCWNNASH
jgi:hypothetical protein